MESTLTSPRSPVKVRFSLTLTLSPLMIWYSGLTVLFLFLLAKAALVYLPTALAVALRPLFPSQQAQYAQVFLLKPAPFCKLLAGLGNANKSATSLLFSPYLPLVLFLPPCPLLRLFFYLKLSGRNCILSPPILSGYNGSSDILFFRGTTRLMSWPHGECYSRLLQPLLVSLIFLLSTSLFLDQRRTVLSKFFDTQVSSISTEELVLPRHARSVLSRLLCNGHSLLLSFYLSRIGRIENSSCSACGHLSSHSALSSYGLLAPLAFWRLSGPDSGRVARLLGHHGFPPCPHPSERVG